MTPWISDLREDEAAQAEDTTMEMVVTFWGSKVKATAKETVTSAGRLDTTLGDAPYQPKREGKNNGFHG